MLRGKASGLLPRRPRNRSVNESKSQRTSARCLNAVALVRISTSIRCTCEILQPGDLRVAPTSLLHTTGHTKRRRNLNRARTRGARKKESGH